MAAKTCIIILGMHRSGTSALTRLCALAGATLPQDLLRSRAGNKTGHWESKAIAAFHDEMLEAVDQSWDDFRPVEFTDTQRDQYRERFCTLVERDFGDAKLIVLKEPRMSRFADLTLSALESMGYRVCIMHAVRHPVEVARSLQTRNKIPMPLGSLYWLRHVVDVETALAKRPHSVLPYDQVMNDSVGTIRRFFSDHDLPELPERFEKDAAEFLDPSLRHHRVTEWAVTPDLRAWLQPVYDGLLSNVPKPPDGETLEKVTAIGNALEASSGPLHALREQFDTQYKKRVRSDARVKTLRFEATIRATQLEEAKAFNDHVVQNVTQLQSELKTVQSDLSEAGNKLVAKQAELWDLSKTLDHVRAQATGAKDRAKKRQDVLKTQLETAQSTILQLETMAEFEAARASASADHIAAMQASTSWRITKPARDLTRLWRNKTRLIVGMMAGLHARQLMQSEDIVASADASRSPSIRDARRALQRSRPTIMDAKWLHKEAQAVADADLPPITVSAVTYNSERWLPKFFKSLVALDYPASKLSIHFVDHGSSDGTIEQIEAFISNQGDHYRSLQLSPRDNLGYGAGNDHAIRSSDDDFVLVTNVDIEFYPTSLRRCAAVARADAEDVACWEFRQMPYEHPKYYDPVTLETNWNAHACVLMRRSAYLDVGGYDTKIFMYGEDVELSYRFRAGGYRLRYVPNATVLHHVELDNADLRPNQLSGSTAANVLLRYRYGSPMDIAAGEALLQASFKNEIDPSRAVALEKAKQILRDNRWHFWRRRVSASLRRKGQIFFPFNEFDYDVARVGADIPTKPFRKTEFKSLPLVSIITRTHGPSDAHLRNAIACVLNQTYPNIEHIIVEDSTDDGRELVEAAAAQFGEHRIRYAKSPGKGRSECGNHGASLARGDWLCWLDNDDLLFADHVETLVRAAQDQPKAVASYALAWDAHSEMVNDDPLMHQFELPDSHRRPFNRQTLMRENFIPIQSILFRKNLFERFGGFNPEFSQLEDWNLWIRYAQVGPFVFTPKVTSIYLTPMDQSERQRRHDMLHDAYDPVSQANAKDVAKIRQSLKSMPKSTPKTASKRAKTQTKNRRKNPSKQTQRSRSSSS